MRLSRLRQSLSLYHHVKQWLLRSQPWYRMWQLRLFRQLHVLYSCRSYLDHFYQTQVSWSWSYQLRRSSRVRLQRHLFQEWTRIRLLEEHGHQGLSWISTQVELERCLHVFQLVFLVSQPCSFLGCSSVRFVQLYFRYLYLAQHLFSQLLRYQLYSNGQMRT